MRRFLRDESAIAVTEYGLLVALVAVLLIAVVTVFGSSIRSWFQAKTSSITTVRTAKGGGLERSHCHGWSHYQSVVLPARLGLSAGEPIAD